MGIAGAVNRDHAAAGAADDKTELVAGGHDNVVGRQFHLHLVVAGAIPTSYDRNSAWLHLAAHPVTVLAWLRLLALDGVFSYTANV